MKQIFSVIAALLFAVSLSGSAFAMDKDDKKMHGSMKGSSMGQTMSMKCAPGKKYVMGYKKKDGTMVKGYCRKAM